jgi:hypothetical protein
MATTKQVTQRLTRESFKQWIQNLDAFLFDCDGGARTCRNLQPTRLNDVSLL